MYKLRVIVSICLGLRRSLGWGISSAKDGQSRANQNDSVIWVISVI